HWSRRTGRGSGTGPVFVRHVRGDRLARRSGGPAVGGSAGEQPLSAGGDGREVLRVSGTGRRGVRDWRQAERAGRRGRERLDWRRGVRAAGRRDHIWRVAERAVLL